MRTISCKVKYVYESCSESKEIGHASVRVMLESVTIKFTLFK